MIGVRVLPLMRAWLQREELKREIREVRVREKEERNQGKPRKLN